MPRGYVGDRHILRILSAPPVCPKSVGQVIFINLNSVCYWFDKLKMSVCIVFAVFWRRFWLLCIDTVLCLLYRQIIPISVLTQKTSDPRSPTNMCAKSYILEGRCVKCDFVTGFGLSNRYFIIRRFFRKSSIKKGNLHLIRDNVTASDLDRYTFSNAMAHSVKLGTWEAMLEEYIDSIEHVTRVSVDLHIFSVESEQMKMILKILVEMY